MMLKMEKCGANVGCPRFVKPPSNIQHSMTRVEPSHSHEWILQRSDLVSTAECCSWSDTQTNLQVLSTSPGLAGPRSASHALLDSKKKNGRAGGIKNGRQHDAAPNCIRDILSKMPAPLHSIEGVNPETRFARVHAAKEAWASNSHAREGAGTGVRKPVLP